MEPSIMMIVYCVVAALVGALIGWSLKRSYANELKDNYENLIHYLNI